jgi:hypothetical protein
MEHGKVEIGTEILLRISREFARSVEWLLTGEGYHKLQKREPRPTPCSHSRKVRPEMPCFAARPVKVCQRRMTVSTTFGSISMP